MAAKTCLLLALTLTAPDGLHVPSPTPPDAPRPAAQRIFDRLVAELPSYLPSKAFAYHLTVLDLPGNHAFTTGAGNICVPQPMVESLLADPKRGEAALAFVLADQIAHVALGQYCRISEQRDAVAQVASFLPFQLPRALVGATPRRLIFTDAERRDADRFALHLCRNAGFDLDAALDSVRREADGADRLKRLLSERDGLFNDPLRYGLFLFDRRSGRMTRCGSRQIGPGQRPIILVHGLHGNKWAFGDYLWFLRDRAEFAERPLLVFRYPNNESLSRCGQFMTREMRRVVVEPDKAVFVCHSSGGLVFRWYAEVRHGGFDKAIFLAVPNAGTRMAEFKGVVDVTRFVLDLSVGYDYAMRNCFGEGDGEIARDVTPGSLFLRRLAHGTPPVRRYQIFYGRLFDFWQALELQAGFVVAKSWVEEALSDFVPFPDLQSRLMRLVAKAPLPEEITSGDFVVSAHSAMLPGVSGTTVLPVEHDGFRFDPEIVRRVVNAIPR